MLSVAAVDSVRGISQHGGGGPVLATWDLSGGGRPANPGAAVAFPPQQGVYELSEEPCLRCEPSDTPVPPLALGLGSQRPEHGRA